MCLFALLGGGALSFMWRRPEYPGIGEKPRSLLRGFFIDDGTPVDLRTDEDIRDLCVAVYLAGTYQAPQARFERATLGLEVRRSIR
jgi:hypothetical protein